MKKILFIDLYFHAKTCSSQFLLDELEKVATVERYCEDEDGRFQGKLLPPMACRKYDIVIFWQVIQSMKRIKNAVQYGKMVYFPMYDATPLLNLIQPETTAYWRQFFDVQIICFCKKLHDSLKRIHFDTHYFQYFPPVEHDCNLDGDPRSLYFWRRGGKIDFDIVQAVNAAYSLNKIHWHDVPDPQFTEGPKISSELVKKISRSIWYLDKEQMKKDMLESCLYLAPRIQEGIGMSFLEAMAMGRCVIAPDSATMNEYIQPNKTGILYNIEHPVFDLSESLVRRIQRNTVSYIFQGYMDWCERKIAMVHLLLNTPSKYQGTWWQKIYYKFYFAIINALRQKYRHFLFLLKKHQ